MRTKNKQTNITTSTPVSENITTPLLQKRCNAIQLAFTKADLVSYWAYFSTPFWFKRLRKLCLRKASKRPGLHYFYFSLLQKVSENTSHSKYKFFNKKWTWIVTADLWARDQFINLFLSVSILFIIISIPAIWQKNYIYRSHSFDWRYVQKFRKMFQCQLINRNTLIKFVLLISYSSMKKKIWNDSDDFWHRKLTLKVRISRSSRPDF